MSARFPIQAFHKDFTGAWTVNERLKVTRFQRLILTRLLGAKAPRRTALI